MNINNKYPIWERYLKSIGESIELTKRRYVSVEHFCYEKQAADKLYELVILGVKTATCGSLWMYQYENEPILKEGDLTILTNYDETRMCIIKTEKVIIKAFNEITPEEAKKEGEGDLSLEYWRKVHKAFFEDECKTMNKEFIETMPVVFEEFTIEYKE